MRQRDGKNKMIKEKYKVRRMEVEGRTFEIKFWEETHFGLPYVSVYEIVKTTKKSLFTGKEKVKEEHRYVSYGWTEENRVDHALRKISEYLKREKFERAEEMAIEAFCSSREEDT